MSHEEERVAAAVERLAAMLGAGVDPPVAWRHLAASLPEGAERALLVLAAEAAARGESMPEVLDGASAPGSPWRVLAAVHRLASRSGAPLAPALGVLGDVLRDRAETERRIEIALAGPQATMRLVLSLPVLGLLAGAAVGIDTLPVLLSLTGLVLLGASALLVWAALAWTRRLTRRARPPAGIPGFPLDLTAMALAGGGSPAAARREAMEALGRLGPASASASASAMRPVEDSAFASPTSPAVSAAERRRIEQEEEKDVHALNSVLALAEASGAPAAGLLRMEARQRRAERSADDLRTVERLGVSAMLPLGLCVLPAFVLSAVLPLIIALISSTALLL